MQKTITSDMMSNLFTTMTLDNGTERIVYSKAYIYVGNDTVEHDLYQLVSNIASESGLSFDFSYEIMSRACYIVAELPIWDDNEPDNDDGIHEAIDNAVPVYNAELLRIANMHDYHLIDEAIEEHGTTSIIEACSMAWYNAIYSAVYEIVETIKDYNNTNK